MWLLCSLRKETVEKKTGPEGYINSADNSSSWKYPVMWSLSLKEKWLFGIFSRTMEVVFFLLLLFVYFCFVLFYNSTDF